MKERYICSRPDGYVVRKTINKKLIYFGKFKTLEEAIQHRSLLEKNGWKKIKETHRRMGNDRYIYKRVTKYGVRWEICKRINGKQEYFGRFDDLEEARRERDMFEKNEWDYENVCSQYGGVI